MTRKSALSDSQKTVWAMRSSAIFVFEKFGDESSEVSWDQARSTQRSATAAVLEAGVIEWPRLFSVGFKSSTLAGPVASLQPENVKVQELIRWSVSIENARFRTSTLA